MKSRLVLALLTILAFPAHSEDINLLDYLIPQERLTTTALMVTRGQPLILTFDRASSSYQEVVANQNVGSLSIIKNFNSITIHQTGKIPLLSVSNYVDDGMKFDVPTKVPDFYTQMFGSDTMMTINRNFKAIVNPPKDLVLTDCISIGFQTRNQVAKDRTVFCKGVGPAQLVVNNDVAMLLDGWEFDFPKL